MILAEYVAQLVADLYVSTSEAGTKIEPFTPPVDVVYVDIGVLLNTFILLNVHIWLPYKYKLSKFTQYRNADG